MVYITDPNKGIERIQQKRIPHFQRFSIADPNKGIESKPAWFTAYVGPRFL